MPGKSIRSFDLRYDLLRNGSTFAQAKSIGESSVSMDTRRKLKGMFAGDLILPENLIQLTDRIRPVVLLDGKEYPVGQFVLTTVEKIRDGALVFHRCKGYDPCFLVYRTRLEERLYLPAGEKYTDWVQTLLQQCGIQNALVEASAEVFATNREDWEVGASVLDVINALLKEICYQPLWFDKDGMARIHPYRMPEVKNIQHRYGPGRAGAYALIKDSYRQSTDLFDVCNVFLAQCANPELDSVMQAVAVNDDPDSIFSIRRQGRVMAPVAKVDNISSQEALQKYAERLRWESMMAAQTTVIQTGLNPIHQCGDIVALEGDLAPGVYEELGWSMALCPGGLMEHTLRRVLYL